MSEPVEKSSTMTAEHDQAADDPDAGAAAGKPTSTLELRLARKPEPGAPDARVWRMRAGPDVRVGLEVLPDEEAPGGLDLGDGEARAAEICLGRGDTDGARKIAAALTDTGDDEQSGGELSDREALGRTLAVRAHLMDGNLDAARAMIGRAREDERLALADAALSLGEGNVKRAKERVDGALARSPLSLAAHYTLALIRVAEGDVEEAVHLLARVAASCAEHAVARHQLGQLTLAAGDPARAGTLFEQATELAPTFIPPALALAEMLVESRQFGEAMNVLTAVTERVPNALSPRLLQLRVLLDIGERSAALALAEALKSATAEHAEVTALWAEALLASGRGAEAREELERLLGSALPADKARLYRILARTDLSASPPRVTEAIGHLEQAIACAPLPGELRLELAQLQLSLSAPDEATAALEALAADARSDLGDLLSGAVMARNHGLYGAARTLGEAAIVRVAGTPAEGQISAFLHSLPG